MSLFHEPVPARPPSLWKREAPAIVTGCLLLAGSAVALPYLGHRWEAAAPHRARVAEQRAEREAAQEAERQARPSVTATPGAQSDRKSAVEAPRAAPTVRQPDFLNQPSFELPASVSRRTRGIIWVYFDCKVTTQGRLADCNITETPEGVGAAAYMDTQMHRVRLSPMTVDGEPRETRMRFSIRFNTARPTGAAPSAPGPAPTPAPRPEPAPPSVSSPAGPSRMTENLRSQEPQPPASATEQSLPIPPAE